MENVKERRKALGWDRATLADRAGVDKAALALIERGMWSEVDALTRVAHVLLQAEAGDTDVRLERPTMPEA